MICMIKHVKNNLGDKTSEEMQERTHVRSSLCFFVPACEMWKKNEGGEKVSDINQPPTSRLWHNIMDRLCPTYKRRGDWGPTAGSAVIASTLRESALTSLDVNLLHLNGWSTAVGGEYAETDMLDVALLTPDVSLFFIYI